MIMSILMTKQVETSEAGSEEDANDDGEESFNLNQPISPAEDGLPPFIKAPKPDFQWNGRSGEDFCNDINTAYDVIALWRKNVFNFPSRVAGKKFVQELTKLN